MGKLFSSRTRSSFELPLVQSAFFGSVLTLLFYGLLLYGPWNNALLKRYCLCHVVAEASLWLFFVGLAGMVIKLRNAFAQRRITFALAGLLDKFLIDGQSVPRNERSLWLEAHWLSLPLLYRDSWAGRRIAEIIERQIKRGKHSLLETDIRDLADADGKAQHESYSVMRMICWSVPLLGFLGTVIGISDTLARLDTDLLATQSQAALKQTTAGLFVAFDTTAIALVLTILAIFVQFSVGRFENDLLSSMDEVIRDNLIEFLGSDARQVEQDLFAPVRQMADDLVSTVHQLVEQQASLWTRSITESQKQWLSWTNNSGEQLRTSLCESLDKSLTNHAHQIEKIQQEAARQVDSRWQQWQITLSDQARVMHAQQKELVRQTESIDRLVTSTCDLQKVEDAVRDSFGSFAMMEKLRESTIGVSEAVAVLASSLERAGIIRGVPIKPRSTRKLTVDTDQAEGSDARLDAVADAVADAGADAAQRKAA